MLPFIVAGLPSVRGRPSGTTLADLIGTQNRVGFDLDFDNNAHSIITDFRDSSHVLDCVASDISRFSSAAFQTINSVPEQFGAKEDIAWSIIKIYYAAFYAGHSLIRLFGESLSYLDRGHIRRISTLAAALQKTPGFALSASSYHCILDPLARCISSTAARHGTGGAHETFWNIFGLTIGRISEGVLRGNLGQVDAQAVFAKLVDLQKGMSAHGAPLYSWLSVVRNDVQYRHHHGVWMPCSIKKQDRELLGRLANQWNRDPMDIDVGAQQGGSLGEFAIACAFIVGLCRCLLERIAARSQHGRRSFAAIGPLANLAVHGPAAP